MEAESNYPYISDILRFKGKLEIELGYFHNAKKTFKQLTKLLPQDSSVFMAYCDILLTNQEYDKCIKHSKISKLKFPELEIDCYTNIIACHIQLGQIKKASEIIETVPL